jgi:protein-tyrosine phosphatase
MYIHWPIKDGPLPEIAGLDGLAVLLTGWLSLGAGVFIHCDAWMNRSTLVATRVLIEQGMDPEEAIAPFANAVLEPSARSTPII